MRGDDGVHAPVGFRGRDGERGRFDIRRSVPFPPAPVPALAGRKGGDGKGTHEEVG